MRFVGSRATKYGLRPPPAPCRGNVDSPTVPGRSAGYPLRRGASPALLAPTFPIVGVDRLGPNPHSLRCANLVPHQSQQRTDQQRGTHARLAEQLRRDEVDEALAPPGPPYDKQARRSAHEAIDGFKLTGADPALGSPAPVRRRSNARPVSRIILGPRRPGDYRSKAAASPHPRLAGWGIGNKRSARRRDSEGARSSVANARGRAWRSVASALRSAAPGAALPTAFCGAHLHRKDK